jgi:hypothetical protein
VLNLHLDQTKLSLSLLSPPLFYSKSIGRNVRRGLARPGARPPRVGHRPPPVVPALLCIGEPAKLHRGPVRLARRRPGRRGVLRLLKRITCVRVAKPDDTNQRVMESCCMLQFSLGSVSQRSIPMGNGKNSLELNRQLGVNSKQKKSDCRACYQNYESTSGIRGSRWLQNWS